MPVKILMPKLGLTMTKGTVKKWHKKDGDKVEKGEIVVTIETEKVTNDIKAPESGILRILVSEGTTVPVGQAIGEVYLPGETLPTAVAPSPEAVAPPTKPPVAPPPVPERARILKREKLSGLRLSIAEKLSKAHSVIPHVTLMVEADASKLIEYREKIAKDKGVKVSYTAILVKACAKALKDYPQVNATLENNELTIYEDVNINVAVATPKGLMVPVIRSADKKSIVEISKELEELAKKAREDKLTVDDVTGGTFSLTNLGMFGIDHFTPMLNPPQIAILGVGRIVKKLVVVDEDKLVIRPMLSLSLTFDHRAIDGVPAAEFLNKVKYYIEHPEEIE